MAIRLRLNSWGVPGLILAIGSLLAQGLPASALEWQGGHEWQAWRWLTASFVHYSPAHLLANLAGCAAVGAFAVVARLPTFTVAAWWIAWPGSTLMLGLWPELTRFGGASGALHAGLAAASVVLAVSARSRRRLLALCVLGGLIVKTMLEQPFLQTLRFDVDLGLNVAVVAHGSGVLCGALSALGVLVLGRLLPAWGTKCGSRQGKSIPGASHPEGGNR